MSHMSEATLALTPGPLPEERENVSTRLVKSHLPVAYAVFLAGFENSQWDIDFGYPLGSHCINTRDGMEEGEQKT